MAEKTFRVKKGLDVEGPNKDSSIIDGVLTLGTIGNISGTSSSILAINSLGSVNINLDTNTNDTNSNFVITEDGATKFTVGNDGEVTLTNDMTIPQQKYINFDSTDTRIGADASNPENLLITADANIQLNPDDDVVIKVGTTEYVRFDGSTQRLGIGTSTPSYDLHVVGSGYFTDDLRVGATSPTKIALNGNDAYVEGQFEASGTAGSYIYSLALGTASPTASSAGKFETSGDVKAGSMTIGGHTFDDIDIGTEFVDADDHIMSSGAIKEKIESYNYLASVDISANTNLAVSSPITLSGDTVGLDDPINLTQLTESTDATDDKILLWDESASSWKYMTLDDLQDSIDTTASGGASALNGLTDVLISNDSIFINNFGGTPVTGSLTSATDNVAIGKDALRIITSADHNIAIGDQAGYDITTGSKNVLIGVEAGGDTDSGIDLSVFIGQHAGLRMKGNENIAIGDNSMTGSSTKADNTGTNNIAIGSPTMNAVTTGSDNVALGQLTLTALTEGSSNVAVGYNALDTLTTGDDNVAIGQHALHQHTTGSDNVSIGPNTMRGAKNTSSSNVAIGKSAGYYMGANGNNIGIGEFATRGSTAPNDNTGQDNIGIGYKTLFVHTGADHNVALGYEAATAITGGDKNVAIGYRSLYAGQSTMGNVAIGATAMDTITGGDYNVALGFNSMGSTDTDLSDNIAIGREAGLYMGSGFNIALGFEAVHGSTTASNNTGVRNIGIGYQAAREYTTGQDNIAVGYQAMESITTGSTNVAIGDRALDALTTGSNNIAIGALAGSATSIDMTGGIFLGVQSGLYMDGDYNIGIGYTAVEGSSTTGNNTGNHNVGIGYQPMMEVTSGYKNVAIGYYAGQDITTGRGNVAIGEDAGMSITTGDFNVTIGNDAGDSLQGGDDNIFIGRNAGQNVTSGSDNVVIGAGVGDLRDATGTKQLLLKSGSDTWLEGFGGDMYFGQNTNYLVPAPTSSNDTAGSVLKLGGGAGTGTASGGDLKLQYAPAGGSSNTTHNSYSDALTVSGSTGDVTIHNKLIVSGTTTTLNTATMTVEDKNIVLGSGNATAEVVDGTGLTLEGGSGDDITFQYNTTDNRMELKHGSAFEDFKVGTVTGTFVGGLTGDVTGNVSGTAATVTGAAQSAITSLGTLTALTGGTGDLIWDTDTLVVDSSANRVGIGTTSPGSELDVDGTITATAITMGNIKLRSTNEIETDSGSIHLQYNTGQPVEIGKSDTVANLVHYGEYDLTGRIHIDRNVDSATDATASAGIFIDYDSSGTNTPGQDNEHYAIYIDQDNSSTAGDAANAEIEMAGIYIDQRQSGDANRQYAVQSYQEYEPSTAQTIHSLRGVQTSVNSHMTHASATVTSLVGHYSDIRIAKTGVNTNSYAEYNYIEVNNDRESDVGNVYGSYNQVDIEGSNSNSISTGDLFGGRFTIDHNDDSVTTGTGYLMYLDWQGAGNVTNPWGLYVTGETKNYFSGNVGVGTTAPEALLDVNTGSGIAIQMGADVNAATLTNDTRKYGRFATPHYHNAEEPIGLVVGDSDGTDNIVNIGGGSTAVNAATSIRFWSAANDATTTGTERMRIDSAGNVGIGTSSPTDSLAVRGGIKIGEFNDTDGTGYAGTAAPSSANTGTGAADPQIRVSGRTSGQPGIIQMAQFDANNFFGGTTEFVLGKLQFAMNENSQEVTTVAEIRGITSDPNDPGHFDGAIEFFTSQGDASGASLTEKMVITADGNVGIGTSSPGSPLHLTSGSGYLKFDTSGSVGSIKSDFNLDLYADDGGNNSASYQNVRFFTAGSNERMRIDSSGNVGIGTTSPLNKLQVDHTGVDGDNGIMVVRADSTTGNNDILGGIGFDSTDGNVPSSVFEASAAIVAKARQDHSATAKGGYMEFRYSSSSKAQDASNTCGMTMIDGKLAVNNGGLHPLTTLTLYHNGGDFNDGLTIIRNSTTVASGDLLGAIGFDGRDGNAPSKAMEASAGIAAYASQDHSTVDKGGHLTFFTSPNDQADDTTSIERMRIRAGGTVEFKDDNANKTVKIHADTNSSPAPRLEFLRGTHDTWGSGDNYTDWRLENNNDLIFYSGFSGQSSGAAVERFRIHSDEDGLTVSGGEMRNNGVGGTYSGNQLSSSDVAFNLCSPFYFSRKDVGTGTVDLRIPNGGDGDLNMNGYVMPKAGKVKAITLHYSGADTPSTSNDHTWMIRVNADSSSDTQTFALDIDQDMDNVVGTNYTTTIVDGIHGYSEYSFSAGELLQIRRSASGGTLDNVNAVLWVQFD